jgi:4-amino-4-deoxy-L-arabinose transferase-like glycosyltransferase
VWVNDGLVMSETLTMVLTVAVLLAAFAWYDAPTVRRGVVLGALFGLAALTRVELLLLVPLMLAPAIVRRTWTPRDRLARVATSLGMCALVLAPWVVFNLSRFDEPTFVSTNDGLTLAGANCDVTYHGPATGLWVGREETRCFPEVPAGLDQSEVSRRLRDAGLDYIRAHESRAAVVAAVRVGRTWSLYRPADMIDFNRGEGRESWVTRAGLYVYYPTLLAAIGGAVVLARRRRFLRLWLVLTPAAVVTIGSVATYGQTRFRAPAEPTLAVLAAVAIIAAWDAFTRRRQVGASTGASSSASVSDTVAATPDGN